MRVRHPHPGFVHPKGFTLIELVIVIAVVSLFVSLTLPVYQDYPNPDKATEDFSLASKLQTVVTESCQVDPTMSFDSIIDAGYLDNISSEYLETLDAGNNAAIQGLSNCLLPWLAVSTHSAAAEVEPTVIMPGVVETGQTQWSCAML